MKILRELATFQRAERLAQREMANAHTQRCIEEHQQRMQQQRNAAMIHALAAQLRRFRGVTAAAADEPGMTDYVG
jgi:hypothetical protein